MNDPARSQKYWTRSEGKVVCAWCYCDPHDFSHHKCKVYLDGSSPGVETRRYLEEREANRIYWRELEDLRRITDSHGARL